MKHILCFLVAFLLTTNLFSQRYSWENPPDVLENQDSLFLKKDGKGDLYLSLFVQPYISMYKLSKFFQVSIEKLYNYNGIAEGSPIQDSTYIKIPFSPDQLITNYFGRSYFKRYHKVYYKVQPKETLYNIAKTTFNTNPDRIARRNHLDGYAIVPNQDLFLGWIPHEGYYEVKRSNEMINENLSWADVEKQYEEASAKGKLKEDKGMAYWKPNSSTSGFFILHKHAKIGSYAEVINPMFGTKLYAKVVARIPKHVYPDEVLAVMSKDAAVELGAKDPRFFVKMRYLQP